ncbi:hypothetical protein [Streptomyces sp. NBC_01353]|uniref:hypothetical protein n=1 Tax=Streptomyces sp. NBC_01353 TaxID=2903835 RepID=UPI002E2EF3B6|nr:hypothetical protein [Streptomyces sp. NBC_01353]
MTQPTPAEKCCECGSADVRYHNYRDQPFCWPCADGRGPNAPKPAEPGRRHTVDTITPDELDALVAERDELLAELIGRDAEARDRWIQKQLDETGLKAMDFRNGMSMEIEPARELVAHWVGAARAMLGDAENYSETPIEMEVKVGESPERYAFVLQRVGKLTPHQARQQAEERAEQAEAALAAEQDISRRLLEQRQEMAAERYAWQERGTKAEATIERMKRTNRMVNGGARESRERAERAEAAIERVRDECDRIEAAVHDNPTNPDVAGGYLACLRHIRAALDEHQEQP